MGSSRVTSPTRPLSPGQTRRRVEQSIQATVVATPATAPTGDGSTIPGVGLMPTPGHLYLTNQAPQILSQYIFGR